MMRTLLGIGVLLVALFFASGLAHAGDDYDRPGFYAGLGLGIGLKNFDISHPDVVDPFDEFDPSGTSVGGDLWVGYRIASFIAVETQLEYLHGWSDELYDNTGTQVADFTYGAMAFTGNVKAFALRGPIQPYAVVGFGLGWHRKSDIGFEETDLGYITRIGGGVDVYGFDSDRWVLTAGATYVIGTGALSDRGYASVTAGVLHRF